jgi:hypothetical protein
MFLFYCFCGIIRFHKFGVYIYILEPLFDISHPPPSNLFAHFLLLYLIMHMIGTRLDPNLTFLQSFFTQQKDSKCLRTGSNATGASGFTFFAVCRLFSFFVHSVRKMF